MRSRETGLATEWLCSPIFASHAFWLRVAYQVAAEAKDRCPSNCRPVQTDHAIDRLARRLEHGITAQAERLLRESGLYRELIRSALAHVDWAKVAVALLHQCEAHLRQHPRVRGVGAPPPGAAPTALR